MIDDNLQDGKNMVMFMMMVFMMMVSMVMMIVIF